jgi:hypothetical protein
MDCIARATHTTPRRCHPDLLSFEPGPFFLQGCKRIAEVGGWSGGRFGVRRVIAAFFLFFCAAPQARAKAKKESGDLSPHSTPHAPHSHCHTSHSRTAWRSPSSGLRVGMNSCPT